MAFMDAILAFWSLQIPPHGHTQYLNYTIDIDLANTYTRMPRLIQYLTSVSSHRQIESREPLEGHYLTTC